MVAEKIEQMFLMKRPISQICDVIANHLIKEFIFKTVSGKKCKEIYVYDKGVYIEKGKDVIEEESEKILGKFAKTNQVNEIRNKIERLTMIDRKKLGNADSNLVCLNNGVLNMKTRKLLPHSPSYNFLSKLPIDYNKDATCENIFEFLSEVLLDRDIDATQEWFGYQLYREYLYKNAVILRGEKNTGKTTFLNLFIKFVGEENISNKSMQKLAEGKWQVASLYKKHANIADDLTNEDVDNTGIFKQVTGRSPISAEEKFGDSFTFLNFAKLMFACNKIPRIRGDVDDDAFWDRWMIFDFENVFDKKDKKTNVNIINEITTEKELSGLLNWSLDGLERLHKQGYFSYKRTWEENKKIMQGEASSVAKFNNECLEYEFNGWISNADLYESYSEFCGLNKITPESEQKFAKDIRVYCNFGKFGIHLTPNGAFGVKHVKVKEVLPVLGL